MAEFDDSKKDISVYNEAQSQIIRLGMIWQKCHNYAMNGDFENYKWQLDRAWVELSQDAKKLNKTFYFQANDKFNLAISNCINRNILYQLLQKKEIFLKGLQEASGKGSKRKREGGKWF